jgi:hypothetical protein
VDQTRGSDYVIWCVAVLLYVFDAARLLAPRELLLVEAGRRRLSAVLSGDPFTLGGRVLCFAPLLRPDRGVFVAPWGRPWQPASEFRAVVDGIERLRGSLGVARVLAWAAAALLFVVGPALTLALGPNAAVVYTAVLVYPTVALAIGWLWWWRRRLGLGAGHSLLVSVEMAICPPMLLNLVRKITGAHALSVDGGQLASAMAADGTRPAAFAPIVGRTEALLEAVGPDSSEADELQRYLVTLRGGP